MVLCGLGMQQYAMYNATIQKTTFFELGVYIYQYYLHGIDRKQVLVYSSKLSFVILEFSAVHVVR